MQDDLWTLLRLHVSPCASGTRVIYLSSRNASDRDIKTNTWLKPHRNRAAFYDIHMTESYGRGEKKRSLTHAGISWVGGESGYNSRRLFKECSSVFLFYLYTGFVACEHYMDVQI